MICALEGCSKEVPVVAIRHGDPYCSSTCFKVAFGSKTAEEAKHDAMMSERAMGDGNGFRRQAEASWKVSGRKRANA
jgi:endogenous inhibitor of DNA gyrase (YacG/DUF329 family)